MDSQRWQQERQPGEAGRGGSHSPYVRDTKVSRGPDASLVAYQDSRTHAARQHWGPTKPYEHAAADAYDQVPRQASAARTYASSPAYASSETHYTTTPTAQYGTTTYQVSTSAAPRTQPADPYSAYQQPTGRDTRDYATPQVYSSYPAQTTTDPYGRQTAPPTGQYAAPRYFGYYDDDYLVYR